MRISELSPQGVRDPGVQVWASCGRYGLDKIFRKVEGGLSHTPSVVVGLDGLVLLLVGRRSFLPLGPLSRVAHRAATDATPTMDAFDADVLIYAAVPGHPLGRPVRRLFRPDTSGGAESSAGVGSVLLIPELLTKPLRNGADSEVEALAALLARLELRPADRATAELAAVLGASYRLRAAAAVHLATAVAAGADRFITNNRSDFVPTITEIDITYPSDLDDR